ncbi:MAG: hypothetical protein AB1644_13170 [Candidatus Zixiibacteriota bacterium]
MSDRARGRIIGSLLYIAAGLGGATACAQVLSTDILPSEDELYEALQLGDIDYDQYQTLYELYLQGVESGDQYLLDEIPNLWHVLNLTRLSETRLEADQSEPFVRPDSPVPGRAVRTRYRFVQRLDDSEGQSQRLTIRADANGRWRSDLKLRRDIDGSEHMLSRCVRYRTETGTIREITLGNFVERYGLGSVIGYRGRLLKPSTGLDDVSILFPNYGGFNGISVRGQAGDIAISSMASIMRDSAHTLLSTGAMIRPAGWRLTPSLILGLNRLANRLTDKSITDLKFGMLTSYRSKRGVVNLEISGQAGARNGLGAMVLEGGHAVDKCNISYAVWRYAARYLDLTGGSKAGNLRHEVELDAVDLRFSDKRAGQTGLLMRTLLRSNERTEFSGAIALAAFDRDTANGQFLAAVVRRLNRKLSLRADYLADARIREGVDHAGEVTDHRVRLEARVQTKPLSVRSYIGLKLRQRQAGVLSQFISVEWRSGSAGNWRLWSNMGRVMRGRLDYWYLFLENTQSLARKWEGRIKIMRSYSRYRTASEQWSVAFELTAAL